MNFTNGTGVKAALIRNPWGKTYYSGKWNRTDPDWDNYPELISQIPFGINPKQSSTVATKGVFVAPMSAFKKYSTSAPNDTTTGCFYAYQIGHNRRSEDYNTTWYDSYNFPDNSVETFYFTPPQKNGDLYFMIDTYTYQMVPKVSACVSNSPILYFRIYVDGNDMGYKYYYYYDPDPIKVPSTSYSAGSSISIVTRFNWNEMPF